VQRRTKLYRDDPPSTETLRRTFDKLVSEGLYSEAQQLVGTFRLVRRRSVLCRSAPYRCALLTVVLVDTVEQLGRVRDGSHGEGGA